METIWISRTGIGVPVQDSADRLDRRRREDKSRLGTEFQTLLAVNEVEETIPEDDGSAGVTRHQHVARAIIAKTRAEAVVNWEREAEPGLASPD